MKGMREDDDGGEGGGEEHVEEDKTGENEYKKMK